jgi:hypothetical protein
MNEHEKITDYERDLAARKAHLQRRESIIEKRERFARALALPKDQQQVIDEAIKLYKIPQQFVFSSSFDEKAGEAHVLTFGGFKIKHKKGEKPKFELTPVQITGKANAGEMAWYEKISQRIPVKFFKNKNL